MTCCAALTCVSVRPGEGDFIVMLQNSDVSSSKITIADGVKVDAARYDDDNNEDEVVVGTHCSAVEGELWEASYEPRIWSFRC